MGSVPMFSHAFGILGPGILGRGIEIEHAPWNESTVHIGISESHAQEDGAGQAIDTTCFHRLIHDAQYKLVVGNGAILIRAPSPSRTGRRLEKRAES